MPLPSIRRAYRMQALDCFHKVWGEGRKHVLECSKKEQLGTELLFLWAAGIMCQEFT